MVIVQKFGGSSLANEKRIRAAAEKVVRAAEQGNRVAVVVSAQGDTTDALIAQARRISTTPSRRELDAFLAAGEQMSAALMAMAIVELGCPAVSLTGAQAGIRTDGIWGDARITAVDTARLRQELEAGKIAVVAGFQGAAPNGDTVTLGRGGSDTTAVALAAYLEADKCEIYTDVDGIYDKDPRRYPDAVRYQTIGYEKMLAMAREGAQVLHDRSVELGMRFRVPIWVKSSFREGAGTVVMD